MKELLAVAFLAMAFVACNPSENVVQTAIAQTEEAKPAETDTPRPTATMKRIELPTPESTDTPEPTDMPEPTSTALPPVVLSPTAIPRQAIDITSLLVEPGDLPRNLTPTVYSTSELITQSRGLGSISLGVNFTNLEFHDEDSGFSGGGVLVFVYDSDSESASAYHKASRQIEENQNLLGLFGFEPPVGERSYGAFNSPQRHLTFERCNSVVYIWMKTATESQISAYAQKLDGRLSNALCVDENQ